MPDAPLDTAALLAPFAGPLARPAVAGGRTVLEKPDVLARGLAKAELRGHRLQHGRAYLEDDGEMAATLAYSRDGRRPDLTFDD
jgi:hypothetical protein